MKPSLSIIIITLNSAETIEKCLQSVVFADEIIVLDSGSQDKTLDICRKYTPHVFQTDWPGFGPQKNRALEKATRDWVFSIDSDEWLETDLQNEIQAVIQAPKSLVYDMPRRNYYCGQWMRYGDVGRDRVIRLFKRGHAQFSATLVHEKLEAQEKIGSLHAPLMHRAYPTITSLLERMNKYSTLSAELRFSQGKKTTLTKAIFASFFCFIKAYFFRLGFLDGKMGFIVATAFAQSSFYRHVKLLEMNGEV